MRAVVFNPGIKENAGIFNHTQGWGVMAECMLGNGDRAYEYYRASMPAAYNDRAEIRQMEPYVQGQTTYSTLFAARGQHAHLLADGAAAWAYYSATQYILGLRPEVDGLRIDPCIPRDWPGFSATRRLPAQRLSRGAVGDVERGAVGWQFGSGGAIGDTQSGGCGVGVRDCTTEARRDGEERVVAMAVGIGNGGGNGRCPVGLWE
jgi:hypothetical protein